MQGETRDAELLTTREVAGLLCIKGRKVYDLVASGEIPHVRVTGKLLLPRFQLPVVLRDLLDHERSSHQIPRRWRTSAGRLLTVHWRNSPTEMTPSPFRSTARLSCRTALARSGLISLPQTKSSPRPIAIG